MRYFDTKPLAIVDEPADMSHMSDDRIGFRFIILHHTGGTNSRKWLSTTSFPRVSSHRLVERDGTIVKIVPDQMVAFTQGFATMGPYSQYNIDMNRVCLSIEIENDGAGQPYPLIQLHNTALQIIEWWGAYGLHLGLLSHLDIDHNKKDPAFFPYNTLSQYLVSELRTVLV